MIAQLLKRDSGVPTSQGAVTAFLRFMQAQTTPPFRREGGYSAYDDGGSLGWFDGKAQAFERNGVMMEILSCIRRAGADLVITYYAKEAARHLFRCGDKL